MTTTYIDLFGIEIKTFFGGKDRGRCIQITIDDKYVQLTTEQYLLLVTNIIKLSPVILS